MADHWMKKAFPEAHRGELHRDLGVAEGRTLPRTKLAAAIRGDFGPVVQRRAEAARTGARVSRSAALRKERRSRAERKVAPRGQR